MQAFLGLAPRVADGGQVGSRGEGAGSCAPPWVEKYRPRSMQNVVGQHEAVLVLQQCAEGAELPHLLLYGPPGTGKTSCALAAARQLFGPMLRERVLELNASDERGIQVVRDKIKTFSQLAASATGPDGRPCPPFKLIILDEADSMTKDAQAALRRTMEKETRSTRFCLICNYVSRIIPPITSRCTKFRFKPIAKEQISERLKHICEQEELPYDEDALNTVIDCSGGDLRRAITCLQSCARLGGTVNKTSILEVTGLIPNEIIDEYANLNDYSKLEKFVEMFTLEAYSASQLLEQLNEIIVLSPSLTNKQKVLISEKLALCEFRLLEGGSEKIQLMDLGCTIILSHKM